MNNLVQQQAAHAEPAFVQERAREYGKRLQKAAHAICLKHAAASTTAGSPSEPGAATSTGSAPMADLSGSKAELEKVLYGQVRRSNLTLTTRNFESYFENVLVFNFFWSFLCLF